MADKYNFQVDLKLLDTAATGIEEAAKSLVTNNVEDDWVPQRNDLGRDDVDEAVQAFGRRWDQGLTTLTEDTEEAARALAGIVGRYVSFDEDAGTRMKAAAKDAGKTVWPKLGFGAR